MVLAFTEEQAAEIRKTGLSVIQFKYCINNSTSHVIRVWNQLINAVERAVEILRNAFECFWNLLDDVRCLFEQLFETFRFCQI